MARIAYGRTDIQARQRLIDELWCLLEVEPFRKVTISQLAERAQCNRATFYYHYEDSGDLLQKALEQELVFSAGAISALSDLALGKDSSGWSVVDHPRLALAFKQVDRAILSEKIQNFLLRLWTLVLCREDEELEADAIVVISFLAEGMLGAYFRAQTNGTKAGCASVCGLISQGVRSIGEMHGATGAELSARLRMVERVWSSLD